MQGNEGKGKAGSATRDRPVLYFRGIEMNEFDYLALVVIIPLGLAIVEIAQGLSRALRNRRTARIGWLTPLLAGILLLNTALVLGDFWETREAMDASIATIMTALVLSVGYYVAASFVFPHEIAKGTDMDDWFIANRKISLGLTIIMVLLVDIFMFSERTWDLERWLIAMVILFVLFSPMLVAIFAKKRRTILIALILTYVPMIVVGYAQLASRAKEREKEARQETAAEARTSAADPQISKE